MDIRTVGVIGAGTMGNGIAHVFAKNGYNVVLVDLEQRLIDRGLQTISKNLEREVAKNKLTSEQRELALGRITGTSDHKRLADCDFVVEAASERFEIKADLFRDSRFDLPARGPPVVQHLVHFDNQAGSANRAARQSHRDALLQSRADDETRRGSPRIGNLKRDFRDGQSSRREIGENSVEVNDAPGFVSNRVLMPLLNEAMYAVMEGVATPEAVDEVFKLGMAHPMGPLTLADFIGLGRLPRHHARDAVRPRRPQIPALPAADQDGRCGLARPQVRARVLSSTSP